MSSLYECDASDPEGARAKVDEHGGCIVRGLLSRDVARTIATDLGKVLIRHDWSRDHEFTPRPGKFALDDIQRSIINGFCVLPSIQQAPHSPGVHDFFDRFFKEPAFLQPIILPRVGPPARMDPKDITAPHQDYLYNQGSLMTTTAWVALASCTPAESGLEFALGTHRGPLYPRTDLVKPDLVDSFTWIGAKYEPGDALLFNALTVHRARANHGDRFRLSIDFRMQPLSEPISEASVAACYSNGISWEEIYAGVADSRVRYYWKRKHPPVVPLDESIATTRVPIMLRASY